MATFLTIKQRKELDAFLRGALDQCHANLYDLCNDVLPERIEDLTPGTRNPEKIIALNKRINAQSRRIEDLLLSIEYPDQCECPDNSFLSAEHAAADLSAAEQAAIIKADLAECFGE